MEEQKEMSEDTSLKAWAEGQARLMQEHSEYFPKPKNYIPEILRQQAEIHCRCLHTAICKRRGTTMPQLYLAGERDSPPYYAAATLFVEDNISDPLRTEILWLREQVYWLDATPTETPATSE